jgi:toxin CptA
MSIELISVLFVFAALCAAAMGFAIQRGATCTVAAVDEVLSKHATRRLAALLEASLWVAGTLLVAQMLGYLAKPPSGYALSWWTVAGGALLGLGAFVNRACVFGAIARLGSGEWAYAVTPLGFYLGCVSVAPLFAPPAPQRLAAGSAVLMAPLWVAAVFLAYVAWRITRPLLAQRTGAAPAPFGARLRAALTQHVWAPHAATIVIAITFVLMLLSVGAWAYTDVLAELARGMAANVWARALLLLALLAGAMFGGVTAGRWRSTPIRASQLLRCLTGGVLMGWGSVLIPGGNDGLILVGMPLLWPYAWVAFATMGVTIALAQLAAQRLAAAGGRAAAS